MDEDLPGPPGSGSRSRPTRRTTHRAYLSPWAALRRRQCPHRHPASREAPSILPGYGPAAQEPQPYAQQYGGTRTSGYGYPLGPQTEGMATAALVIAIAGFFDPPSGGRDRGPGLGQQRQAADRGLRRAGCPVWSRPGWPGSSPSVELVLTAIVVLVGIIVGAIAITTSGGLDEPVPVPPHGVGATVDLDAGSSSGWITVASSVGSPSASA